MSGPERTGPWADVDTLRAALRRAVARTCPAWLASEQEDLVQSALLRILDKAPVREDGTLPASYVWRVGVTTVLDELRRRRRRPRTVQETSDGASAVEALSDRSPESTAVRGAIVEGLKRMSADRRRAVLLFLYGFSLKEAARLVGVSTKSHEHKRYEGLAELRDFLRKSGIEERG